MPFDTSNQGPYLLSQWLQRFSPRVGDGIRTLLEKKSGQIKVRDPFYLEFPIRVPVQRLGLYDFPLGLPSTVPPPTSVVSSVVSSWLTSSIVTSTSSGGTGTSGSFLSTTTSDPGTSSTTGGGGTDGGQTTPGDGSVTTTGGGDTTGSGVTTSGDYSSGATSGTGSTTGGGDTSGGNSTGYSGTIIVDSSGSAPAEESSYNPTSSGTTSGSEEGCSSPVDPTMSCAQLPLDGDPDLGLGCLPFFGSLVLCGTNLRSICYGNPDDDCPPGCSPTNDCDGCQDYDYDCCYSDGSAFAMLTYSGCCCAEA